MTWHIFHGNLTVNLTVGTDLVYVLDSFAYFSIKTYAISEST